MQFLLQIPIIRFRHMDQGTLHKRRHALLLFLSSNKRLNIRANIGPRTCSESRAGYVIGFTINAIKNN